MTQRIYSTEPCFKDCWKDGLYNAHYHEVDGNDMIKKISHSFVKIRSIGMNRTDNADESVQPRVLAKVYIDAPDQNAINADDLASIIQQHYMDKGVPFAVASVIVYNNPDGCSK